MRHRNISLVSKAVVAGMALLCLLSALCGCENELDKASAATKGELHRALERMKYLVHNKLEFGSKRSSYVRGTISRSEKALDLLSRHPHMPSNDPFLLYAVLRSSPSHGYTIFFTWIERGFRTEGVYLKDESGRTIELIDRGVFQDDLREYYEGAPTFYRFRSVQLIPVDETEGVSGRRARGRSSYPAVEVPKDFVDGTLRIGLISDGEHFPARKVFFPDPANPTPEKKQNTGASAAE